MAHAHSCPTIAELLSCAVAFNNPDTMDPLPHSEVERVIAIVWSRHSAGENWIGSGRRLVLGFDDIDGLLSLGGVAASLMLKLQRGETLCVANAMAGSMPDRAWTEKRFRTERNKLLAAGRIIELRPASMKH